MTPADLDAVLAIEQSVQAYPWTRGNFVAALEQGYICRVDAAQAVQAQDHAAIRAYAVLMPVLDEAELLNIGVVAGQQRRGWGRALLAEMLGQACAGKMCRVFLEVRASNIAALALYRSSGFVEIGVRRAYYRNDNGSEDAITMACELKEHAHG